VQSPDHRITGDLSAPLRWQALDGSLVPGQRFLLHGHRDEPVGCAGITTRELWSGDPPLRAAQFANLAIAREHRTLYPRSRSSVR
jgi:hypothetical protein